MVGRAPPVPLAKKDSTRATPDPSNMFLPPFQVGSPSPSARLFTSKQQARLAKKRARDRRSQQAMRNRNRGELEALRMQVGKLTEQLAEAVTQAPETIATTLTPLDPKPLPTTTTKSTTATTQSIDLIHQHYASNGNKPNPVFSASALENQCLRQENDLLRRQLDSIHQILGGSRTPICSTICPPSPTSTTCTIAFDSAVLERWWSRSIARRSCAAEEAMGASPPQVVPIVASTTTLDTHTPAVSTPPIWLPCRTMPSPHVAPTCPSDRIMQLFIEEQRRTLRTPTQTHGCSTPTSLSSSVSPDSSGTLTSPPPSVAQMVATLLDTYMEIDNLPKKVACLYVLSTVVNWLVLQTQEAFELMPVWMRPVAAQIQIPHPAWIDRIIWPSVRDYLVRHQDITFDKYTFAYTLSFSIAWPWPDDHILLPSEGNQESPSTVASQKFSISPLFIEHIRNLSNWVVGTRMCQHYPDMGKAAEKDRCHFGT